MQDQSSSGKSQAVGQHDTPEGRKHKAFRLHAETSRKLKETATLFGRSETSMLELMIDTYYEKRREYFKEDSDSRLKGI